MPAATLETRGRAAMTPFKYRAFLSYSHRDTIWAKWLHRALESYHIDKDLVGRDTPQGPVPKTLRPIFRDRDDFSAGPSLTEQTAAALEASQFLIVVCSPNAARSAYVNEEIRAFKAQNGGARVIPLIVDGDPTDPTRQCFPPALRLKVGADGVLTDAREEPIAADVRPEGDSREAAKLKIVAGLLGVGLDEVVRRAERARKRRNRIRSVAAGMAAIVVSVTVLGWAVATSLNSKLDSSQLVNIDSDAAYLCDRALDQAAPYPTLEAGRIALAVKCLDVLGEGLDGLPPNVHVPLRLRTSLERNLAVLRAFKNHEKLTATQIEILAKAEALISRLDDR